MPDAWRAYLEMALGLTETPRKRAQKAVGDLVNRGGATAAQLQGLVEDLLSAGMANREALTNIVRYEVDKALGAVGLATAEEVDELTARVRDLEKELRVARAKAVPGEAAAPAPAGGTRLEKPAPAPKKVAKKTVAKKAVKAAPTAMPVADTTPASPVAKKAAAKKTAAKKTAAKKTVAKKAVQKAGPATPAAEPEVPPLTEPVGESLPPAEAAALAELAGEPAPAKKAAAKKAPARKAVAKKAPAKKAAPTPEPTAEPGA
jgi:polyhydroxyalkanoate synthesis regulator phasin